MPDKMDEEIDEINKRAIEKRESDLRRRALSRDVVRERLDHMRSAHGSGDAFHKDAAIEVGVTTIEQFLEERDGAVSWKTPSAAAGKSREREYPAEAENVAYEQGRADESMARADMHRECAQVLEMVSNRLRSLPPPSVEEGYSPGVKAVEELRELTALRKEGEAVAWRARRIGDPHWFFFGSQASADAAASDSVIVEPLYAHPSPAVVGEGAEEPSIADLQLHLRTLISYARWQMTDGANYHPTLPSAVAAASTVAGSAIEACRSRALLSASPSIDKEGA
jgi:hypothetical protein